MEKLGETIPKVLAKCQEPRTTENISREYALRRELFPMPDIPPRYHQWQLADYPYGVAEQIRPFFSRRADTVFLYGSVGTRKTSLAAAILREWRCLHLPSDGWQGYGEFATMPAIADAARDFTHGKHVLAQWQRAKILVVDDIGAARNTPHIVERLLFPFLSRYDRGRPTIVTSNLTLAELGDAIDVRIASRLQEGVVLDLGTKDKRFSKEIPHE